MLWSTPHVDETVASTCAGSRIEFGLGGRAPLIDARCSSQEPASPLGIDFHEALEFGIVLEGCVERRWAAYSTQLGPGDVWLCGSWEPHGSRRPVSGGGWVTLIFLPEFLVRLSDHARVEWLDLFRAPPPMRPGVLPAASRAAMLREGSAIAREIKELRPGWSSALAVHLLRCLGQLATQKQGGSTARDNRTLPEMDSRIEPALRLVSRQKGRVPLQTAANLCRLSKTRFSAVFAGITGISFGRFCMQTRLGHVARLLLTTDQSIGTIAGSLGFSSSTHLCRMFRKHYNCTPVAFRNEGGSAQTSASDSAEDSLSTGQETPADDPIGWDGPTPWEADVRQEFEFGIVLSGTQERRWGPLVRAADGAQPSDGEKLCVGDVWLCAMWEPHWRRTVAPGTSYVVVHFAADYLGAERTGRYAWFELFAVPPGARPRVGSPALRKLMLSLGHRIQEELAHRRESWQQAVRLYVLAAMVELARHWNPPDRMRNGDSRTTVRDTDLHKIIPALERVNSHLPDRLPLQDAAEACGMSRSFFCSVFRRSMGVSFAEFVLRARLVWVAGQLVSSAEAIASLAASAGFTDESHLHRTFVEHYGCTPGVYRQAKGKQRPTL